MFSHLPQGKEEVCQKGVLSVCSPSCVLQPSSPPPLFTQLFRPNLKSEWPLAQAHLSRLRTQCVSPTPRGADHAPWPSARASDPTPTPRPASLLPLLSSTGSPYPESPSRWLVTLTSPHLKATLSPVPQPPGLLNHSPQGPHRQRVPVVPPRGKCPVLW